MSSEGAQVYVTNPALNTLSVIDAASKKVTATIPVGDTPFAVAVSPDGAKVYVANMAPMMFQQSLPRQIRSPLRFQWQLTPAAALR